MKKIRKTALLVTVLVLLFLQAGCAHAKKSDYSVETLYRRDGYASELSLRLYSTVYYKPTVELFGMRLDGVEYSYTTIRADDAIENLRYRQRSDLLRELEQDFRKALPEEQKMTFSEVDMRAVLEFADKTFLLFEGSASVSAASAQRYPCVLVQCDPNLQVAKQVEFTMEGSLGADSLTWYEGGYLCIMPHASFESAEADPEAFAHAVWLDRDLNLPEEPPVDTRDRLLSGETLRQYLKTAEQEEISRLAEDIQKIHFLQRVGDTYCCLLQQGSAERSHFYVETDLQGTILLVKHLTGMNIESADVKRYDEDLRAYFDVAH